MVIFEPMQEPSSFYAESLKRYIRNYGNLKKRLRIVSFSRLLAFLFALLCIYFFRNNLPLALVFSITGMALFLFLVRHYEDVKTKFRFVVAMIKVNETELRVLRHQFDDLPEGKNYDDAQHAYCQDLDLFGAGSFFQYLNRTHLFEGSAFLAKMLKDNGIERIIDKQEAIATLAKKPEWSQHFRAHASLVQYETKISEVVAWLEAYKPFVPKTMRVFPWVFLIGFVTVAVSTYFLQWSLVYVLLWLLSGLTFTGGYFARIRQLALKADRIKATFKQHSELLDLVENTVFETSLLEEERHRLIGRGIKASKAIGQFSRLLNTMDYNNNIFFAIFGNGCFLGALLTAYHIEAWIKAHKSDVEVWFGVIAFFEAYTSLGNFAYNHSNYTYPEIGKGNNVLDCTQLGHPLIPEAKNIKNDFAIGPSDFFIITGSNMAGKSTFLRSVGLCMVMANLGLPVHADRCVYQPHRLVTSMRTVDSLQKGDSYFLSELKRLQMIVQLLESGPYFVLLDEILKGTNSTDKAVGSKKFLARLLRTKAIGLIATHDLSLCETAEDYPTVFNYHLDATIADGELSFDYLLKKGVSRTMNASFLLEKMDLI
ncbi:MAG: DNA mismatch repair protein MutS [Bacteroidota bacterium]